VSTQCISIRKIVIPIEEFLLVEKRELFAAAWDSLRGPVTKLQKANVGA
jgi:hypothetical protein